MKRLAREIVAALFATSGIRLDKLSLHRILLLGASFVVYFLMITRATFHVALAYYLTEFVLRYLFLFGSFVRGGIAERLMASLGEEKGYEVYETVTALMFFHSASAFSTLVKTTQWTLFPGLHPTDVMIVLGILLSGAGFVVNIWATLIIGVDIYYYKDLFLGRFLTDFKQQGPYRVFKNPMYGIGQSAAYGAALMSGSLAGIIVTLVNQAMMYTFYFTIEKPHIMNMISRSRARSYPDLGTAATSSASQ